MPADLSTAARRQRRTTALTAVLALVAAPITVAVGMRFDGGGSYITSLLIVLYALIPFFAAFESRRPTAHDVVVVAVLCALAVVARAAFFWIPYVTALTAVIIVAGIALGPTSGFMVGAVSLFASNFLFAQGPWTPWQMLAYGLAGFVFGLLAQKGKMPRSDLSGRQRVALSLSGCAFVVCVLGPVLDTSSVFLLLNPVTPAGALGVYAAGLPVNLVHGVSTAVVLFLVANPILGHVGRIRLKYGLAG